MCVCVCVCACVRVCGGVLRCFAFVLSSFILQLPPSSPFSSSHAILHSLSEREMHNSGVRSIDRSVVTQSSHTQLSYTAENTQRFWFSLFHRGTNSLQLFNFSSQVGGSKSLPLCVECCWEWKPSLALVHTFCHQRSCKNFKSAWQSNGGMHKKKTVPLCFIACCCASGVSLFSEFQSAEVWISNNIKWLLEVTNSAQKAADVMDTQVLHRWWSVAEHLQNEYGLVLQLNRCND